MAKRVEQQQIMVATSEPHGIVSHSHCPAASGYRGGAIVTTFYFHGKLKNVACMFFAHKDNKCTSTYGSRQASGYCIFVPQEDREGSDSD